MFLLCYLGKIGTNSDIMVVALVMVVVDDVVAVMVAIVVFIKVVH